MAMMKKTVAIQRLFQVIEQQWGGLDKMMDTGHRAEVITTHHYIESKDIHRLMSHEATALHVKEFYDKQASIEIGKQLASEALRGKAKNWKVSTSRGLESSDVSTLGEHPPYNVVMSNNNNSKKESSSKDQYFEGALHEMRKHRRPRQNVTTTITNEQQDQHPQKHLLFPSLWPLDQLRLELDEAWGSGAGLAREQRQQQQSDDSSDAHFSRPFGGGLPRIMMGPTRWRQGYIHVDELAPLNVNEGLFSANIYLQLPTASSGSSDGSTTTKGTEALHIWPLGIRSKLDWYKNALTLSGLTAQDPEMQVMLRQKLGEPQRIFVEPGDLVILCVQRPHAAVGFSSSHDIRVSMQCFINHTGPNHRLLIDC